MKIRARHILVASGFVLVAALVVGIAGASIPQGGVITGCYMKSGGTLRVIDPAVTKCKSSETILTWNQQGQPSVGALVQTDLYQTSETDDPLHMTALGQWYTLVSIHKPAGGWWDKAAVTASINIASPNKTAVNCFISDAGAPLITFLQPFSVAGPQTLNFTVPYSSDQPDVKLECRLPDDYQPSPAPYDVMVGWATLAVVPATYADTVAH